tara:strand:- start:587 stop:2488 length:1902 start_codon:yes stop_codon:yes gene_type:complete
MYNVEIRDHARELFEEGLTIVPASREKKMPIVRWREWQEQNPPDELVEYWFASANFRTCNFAIVTGRQIVVIDTDSAEAEIWVKANLTYTPRSVKTSRGRHFYFKAPSFEVRNSTDSNAKIDVRGLGGIVIAPGSVHESGAVYEQSIDQGEEKDWRFLPELCNSDLEKIKRFNNPVAQSHSEGWHDRMIKQVGALVALKSTDDEILLTAERWREDGYSIDQTRAEIQVAINGAREKGWDKEESEEEKLVVLEEKKSAMAPKPFDLTDFSSIPPREWIYGRHYIRKFLSVTVAGGGTGKTALTMTEAVAMATGRDLLGQETEKRRVWIWNLEDPLEELQRRLAAIMIHYRIKPEDYAERLFVNSGRDERLIVTQQIGGQTIYTPVVDLMIEFITKAQIDVVMVDPFVSTHDVNENDNQQVDAVVKAWSMIADKANCAIELVHHTRKAQPNSRGGSFDDARGASALTDAARHVRRLMRMSPDEARTAGIDENQAWRYTREADSKDNLAPPSLDDSWRQMRSIDLPNGDNVGVVEAWAWPDAFSDVDVRDLGRVKNIVSEGEYREDVRAANWVGHAVAEALELDINEKGTRGQIKSVMRTWLANKEFKVVERIDPKSRKKRTFVEAIFNTQPEETL